MPSKQPVILVVEDDAAMSTFLRGLLEPAGYRVEITPNGAGGLARIENGGVDLILLDLVLPDVDGLELCRQVRAREGDVYLPIIMLTALAEKQRHAGFTAGADD